MIEVISIKFKNRGKSYFFDPRGLAVKTGDKVVVETSKGLELADCTYGNHAVEETAVIQPLRPVARVATEDDLRVARINKKREQEAFTICQQKIAEHGLDMKLVDVECNFEGNKTTFYFTSDGRVDFRELVKDLAGIFRNRIELRQIGVRDEAKMIGGIAICGRPYCCSQFLEDFQPVSTKMAKVQSLSLNPTKISGSCGRLMCCLRYEQEAYEELIKKVPKQGAFVETKDGYGTAVQVNLLRQTVKVKLDGSDDTLHTYKPNELAAVPGGRPRDGETPPPVLHYVPEEEIEEAPEQEDEWALPELLASEVPQETDEPAGEEKKRSGRRRRKRDAKPKTGEESQPKQAAPVVKVEKTDKPRDQRKGKGQGQHGKATVKPVRVEPKPQSEAKKPDSGESTAKKSNRRPRHRRPKSENKDGSSV